MTIDFYLNMSWGRASYMLVSLGTQQLHLTLHLVRMIRTLKERLGGCWLVAGISIKSWRQHATGAAN